MSVASKLREEVRSLTLAFLYFMIWIGGFVALKALVLAEYHIQFSQWSMILVGALVLAKVVLILEHVSFGAWVGRRPAWVAVVLRTALYTLGVFLVLLLEKGFEGRHEYGSFAASVTDQLNNANTAHILASTLCLCGALLGYNVYSVIRLQLGERTLADLFLSPLPAPEDDPSGPLGRSGA